MQNLSNIKTSKKLFGLVAVGLYFSFFKEITSSKSSLPLYKLIISGHHLAGLESNHQMGRIEITPINEQLIIPSN